jgi:hypothetical protein
LSEELNRKTLEAIEWLVSRFEQGQLLESQLLTGLDTVFMTVSGLVDFEVIRVLTETAQRGRNAKVTARARRIFVRARPDDACVLALTWAAGSDQIVCSRVSLRSMEVADTRANCANAADAKRKLGLLVARLEAGGYREI